MTLYKNHNEMMQAMRIFMQENIMCDYIIKTEKHTHSNGEITYLLEMRLMEKYKI